MDKFDKKIVIGLHSLMPAPIWTEAHQPPSQNLYGCVKAWKSLTLITQYDKVAAFDVALEVLDRWSQDIRTESVAMEALWDSPRLTELNESLQKLNKQVEQEILGGMKTFSNDGTAPPSYAAWNDGAQAELPADLQASLKAQERALREN